jgi:hypothetical protein
MRKRKFTRQVGVVMSEETYALLIRITNTRELPMSEFIRDIVDNTLQEMVEEGDRNGSTAMVKINHSRRHRMRSRRNL